MRLDFLWPGRTKSPTMRAAEEFYLGRIMGLADARIVATRAATGLSEREAKKILEIEAEGLEKYLDGTYIICLVDKGKQMSSEEFSSFIARRGQESAKPSAFVVGGFLGLADRLLEAADLRLSLSRMTFTHELSRVMLLEQVYRSLTMIKGMKYAK